MGGGCAVRMYDGRGAVVFAELLLRSCFIISDGRWSLKFRMFGK